MSDQTETHVTIKTTHPRETARALLDAAKALGLSPRRVRTANELGRAVFVVPVEVADAANDDLEAIHAHDDAEVVTETPATESESVPGAVSDESEVETPEGEAGEVEADSTETPAAE